MFATIEIIDAMLIVMDADGTVLDAVSIASRKIKRIINAWALIHTIDIAAAYRLVESYRLIYPV